MLKLDWYRLGKVIGSGQRCLRFADLETGGFLEKEGVNDLKAEDEKSIAQILGESWLEKKGIQLAAIEPSKFVETLVIKFIFPKVKELVGSDTKWSQVAYQWGPEAMAEFNRGLGDGINSFIDADGEFVGETTRTTNYIFFLLAWPEIKKMLKTRPLPTRTDLFNWTRPFHAAGLVCIPTIENMRDFCEDIRLKLAGRTPKKTG